MKNAVGINFKAWCAIDPEDTRKINYTLHKGGRLPETFNFTSEDTVDGLMMDRIQNSTIKKLTLVNDEWHVVLA